MAGFAKIQSPGLRNGQGRVVADLHCHTSWSDNDQPVRSVIRLARARGVTHLAITDHDTTAGLPEAIRCGREEGITVIPGIELSAWDGKRNRRAHILGYFVEPGHPALEAVGGRLLAEREEAARQMTEKLAEAGYRIDWETVKTYAASSTTVYKQHILHALMDAGYCDSIRGALARRLFSRGDNGRPPGIAYVPVRYMAAETAIRAILDAGGVPVLAHPGQLGNFEAVEEWVGCGLMGIEAYHPSHTVAEIRRALALAERYGLGVTGGSDYHGNYGEDGEPPGTVHVGAEHLELLMRKRDLVPHL